jgi:hypothetical protein
LSDISTSAEEGHVYRVEIKPVNQWLGLLILVALGAPLLAWMTFLFLIPPRVPGGYDGRLWCLLALIAPATLFGLAKRRRLKAFRLQTYLRVTPEELEYYTPGLRIRTPWANIAKIDDGIAILHQADLREIQFWAWFWSVSAHLRSRRDPAITQMISLILFGWTKSSQVVHDIQRYAPHLGQGWMNKVPYREFLE